MTDLSDYYQDTESISSNFNLRRKRLDINFVITNLIYINILIN